MSQQNLQISIIEIRDLSSVVININDISSIIINIKKYNINDNIILSKSQLIKYKYKEQIKEFNNLMEDPDVIKCLCCILWFLLLVIISLIIRHNNN